MLMTTPFPVGAVFTSFSFSIPDCEPNSLLPEPTITGKVHSRNSSISPAVNRVWINCQLP